MKTLRLLLSALFVLLSVRAFADVTGPTLLVAPSGVTGAYARTVLFAMPTRDGSHVGFVLNRPTDVRLPGVKNPVFAGGPEHTDALFAFVRTSAAPVDRALAVLPGLYLAFRESDVELVLERFASRTRVFAGMVSWEAEALDDEVESGLWLPLDADVELVLEGSVDSLWSRLIGRAETMTADRGRFIRAGGVAAAAPAAPVAPDALMKQVTDDVVASLQRIQSDPKRVYALVEEKLLPHFDAPRATRIAVGAYWRQASPEQQARLVKEFTTLLVRTYSGALASYSGQKVEFSPLRARPGDAEVTVRSAVRQPGAEPIVIEYDLERAGDAWKVFDVRVAGMSLVASYRSAFAEHARNHGVDGLISLLAGKNSGFPRELRM
jgi:phospholipid transport system substrate-binding protein